MLRKLGSITAIGGGLLFVTVGAALAAQPICDKSQIRLVEQVQELAQPYHQLLIGGGKALAAWAGISPQNFIVQVNQRDADRSVGVMRALLATDAKCTVFNVEPVSDDSVQSLVDAVNDTGAWLVTHWGHGKTSEPFDPENGHWIAHVAVNTFDQGAAISKALFESMGGKGSIVALQGDLDSSAATNRFKGLQKVLKDNPGITLLDDQSAQWDRAKAFPIVQTWLSKYGDKIKGIWAANDDMAFGALEALRGAGLAGKIPVVGADGTPEAVAAVQKGEMAATVSTDAFYQGSIGLAMGVCVLTGQVDPPEKWTKEHREFYLRAVLIDKSNADQYAKAPDPAIYEKNDWACDKIFARDTGPAY